MLNAGSLTCSLQELERRFALETDTWLRQKLETGNLAPETATAFVRARERCARRLNRHVKSGLIPSITDCLQHTKLESRVRAISNLNKHLGTLVERFGASSGSLSVVRPKFGADGEEVLEELLSHNVPSDWKRPVYPLTLKNQPCGITVLAACTKQGYVADDVKNGNLKRFYIKAIPTTVSEIAIPIFSIDRQTVEGVINLESDEPNAFLLYHIGELQAASWLLLPDLLILKHLENVETSVGWHPSVHGWGMPEILQRLCDRVSTSQSIDSVDQRLICTIWYADWTKASLYVQATARFNFEYMSRKVMPLQFRLISASKSKNGGSPQIPKRSWMSEEQSFTGYIADHDRGQVKQGRVADMPGFHRPERASKMGIEYIIATPIYRPSKDEDQQSTGVLSLYFFRRQQPRYAVNIAAGFPEPDVVWLADVIGGVFNEIINLSREVAIATLLSRINEEGIPHLNLFDILRNSATEFLEADGCTVLFASRASHDGDTESIDVKYKVLSTTGLISDKVEKLDLNSIDTRCVYVTPADPKYVLVRGITGFITLIGSGLIRKTDVQDPWETGAWQAVAPVTAEWSPLGNSIKPETLLLIPDGAAREETAPTESDHRRLLAASVLLPDSHYSGIMRVVRRAGATPFIQPDGLLLSDLNDIFVPYYNDEIKYNSALDANPFAAKLLARNANFHIWNGHYVEAILQYLIKALSEERSINQYINDHCSFDTAYLRVRSFGAQWQKVLRLYAHFSRESGQIVTEQKATDISDPRSLEWYTVESNRALITSGNLPHDERYINVLVSGKKLKFRPFNRGLGDNRFIIFIPFSVDSRDANGDILMCIEGHLNLSDPSEDQLKVILQHSLHPISQCCRLLACIGRNNVTKRKVAAGNGDTWLNLDDIISTLRQQLADDEGIELVETSPTDTTFKLWYGCVPLPGMYSAFRAQKVITDEQNITPSVEAIVLDCWRELILSKRYSPAIICARNEINSFKEIEYIQETKLVQTRLDNIAS